jgi:hypothetical protein
VLQLLCLEVPTGRSWLLQRRTRLCLPHRIALLMLSRPSSDSQSSRAIFRSRIHEIRYLYKAMFQALSRAGGTCVSLALSQRMSMAALVPAPENAVWSHAGTTPDSCSKRGVDHVLQHLEAGPSFMSPRLNARQYSTLPTPCYPPVTPSRSRATNPSYAAVEACTMDALVIRSAGMMPVVCPSHPNPFLPLNGACCCDSSEQPITSPFRRLLEMPCS